MHDYGLFIAVFLACAVESVEAVTIVIAAGIGGDWKSSMRGVYAALASLAAIIVAFGPLLTRIPVSALQIAVGALLLVFGLQWMRKAILRASGWKAQHDEAEIFQTELAQVRSAGAHAKLGVTNWYAFTLSFKGVFLEGLEVVFIVLTFGALQDQVTAASVAAISAAVAAAAVGLIARRPLTRVPENLLKYIVGIMLIAFGMFWTAEGVGADWPFGDAALIGIIVFSVATSQGFIVVLKSARARRDRTDDSSSASPSAPAPAPSAQREAVDSLTNASIRRRITAALCAFVAFWIDFIIGDDPRGAAVVALGIWGTWLIAPRYEAAWMVIPFVVVICMSLKLLPGRISTSAVSRTS